MTVKPQRFPALVAADWGRSMAAALGRLVAQTDRPEPNALSVDGRDGSPRLYAVIDGIAIIPIRGILVAKFPWIGCGWITGYDALRCQFTQAFADPDVRAIVMDIESGGGEVSGCFDLVDWIAASKTAAGKPVAAILSDYAYSAAYALASVADSIAVPQMGGVGSVGVVMLHMEYSKWLDEIGIKPTFIHAGQHKVDGNPYQPLPDEVRAAWQAECEEIRNVFCETVARNRSAAGVSLRAEDVMATEARVYSSPAGLAEAIKIGLADAILPPDAAFAQVVALVAGDVG